MNTMATDEIRAIGETFKRRRKEMNMSLKEVENATSIRSSYLQAIEDGAIENGKSSDLISPIYAQGFLRQYANFLGIDGDAIIRENAHYFHRLENQEFSYGIGTLEMRGNPGAGVKWVPNLVWIAAFGGLFLAAWYLVKYLDLY